MAIASRHNPDLPRQPQWNTPCGAACKVLWEPGGESLSNRFYNSQFPSLLQRNINYVIRVNLCCIKEMDQRVSLRNQHRYFPVKPITTAPCILLLVQLFYNLQYILPTFLFENAMREFIQDNVANCRYLIRVWDNKIDPMITKSILWWWLAWLWRNTVVEFLKKCYGPFKGWRRPDWGEVGWNACFSPDLLGEFVMTVISMGKPAKIR